MKAVLFVYNNFNISLENCKGITININGSVSGPVVPDSVYNSRAAAAVQQREVKEVLADELDKYSEKKRLSLVLSDIYGDLLLQARQDRVYNCGTFLEFAVNSANNVRLSYINSCKDRLCPTCQFRRGYRLYRQVSQVLANLAADKGNMYFMLTLTTVNVGLELLQQEITKVIDAFRVLSRRQEFKKLYKGYVRVVELVVDREQYITADMYNRKEVYYRKRGLAPGDLNPNYLKANVHIHCILHTTNQLYKHNYIKKARLLELWQQATQDKRNIVIDIREIKDIKAYYSTAADINKAVAEVCKYSVKPLDLIRFDDMDKEVVYAVLNAISGRRLFTAGGTLSVKNINMDNDELAADDDETFYRYYWHYTQRYRPIEVKNRLNK